MGLPCLGQPRKGAEKGTQKAEKAGAYGLLASRRGEHFALSSQQARGVTGEKDFGEPEGRAPCPGPAVGQRCDRRKRPAASQRRDRRKRHAESGKDRRLRILASRREEHFALGPAAGQRRDRRIKFRRWRLNICGCAGGTGRRVPVPRRGFCSRQTGCALPPPRFSDRSGWR